MKVFLVLLILLTVGCEDSSSEASQENPLAFAPASGTETQNQAPSFAVQTMAEEFMTLVNDHRISLGLQPLEDDGAMSDIAQLHSGNMASGKISFGHDGFSSRCADARVAIGGGNLCGENVATGQSTAQAVFNQWMKSSAHKGNIEKARFTHSGFAYKKSSSGSYYWTHLFLEKQ